MENEELFKSPQNHSPPKPGGGVVQNGGETETTLFSPRFRSVAEMAGWDEEALLIASLIVEDTPDRDIKQKKRSGLQNFKSPPTNSRRKRRAQRRSPNSMPIAVLDLEDDVPAKEEIEKNLPESRILENEHKETNKNESNLQGSSVPSSSSSFPCIDKLREELSCAICLEICFEPSTTPCGHSFCKKCLRSAADKCGKKCPKCRQLISNGRSCTVNTVLWNTIQLLFPQEIEARKESSGALNTREAPRRQSPSRVNRNRNRNVELLNSPESENRDPRRNRRIHDHTNRRQGVSNSSNNTRPSSRTLNRGVDVARRRNELPPSQDEDAALAMRLQRREFMDVFRGSGDDEQRYSSLAAATQNLRAMATRAATSLRNRGRTT